MSEKLKYTRKRNFFAHHILIGAARMSLEDAENKEPGWYYSELIALTMSALAMEAICNAVGEQIIHK
jgi:hypothetical protein